MFATQPAPGVGMSNGVMMTLVLQVASTEVLTSSRTFLRTGFSYDCLFSNVLLLSLNPRDR